LPQAPQFIGSDTVLTQAIPHDRRPLPHTHALPVQVWLDPQRTAQPPQLLRSLVVFTQIPEHAICPLVQRDAPPEPPVPPELLVPPLPLLSPSSSGAGPQATAINAAMTRVSKARTVRARMPAILARFPRVAQGSAGTACHTSR
jgi:hypothetical protein